MMNAIKNNKWKLLLSSLVILLPMLLPLLIGHLLPEEIAVHWGLDGTADGFMSPWTIFLILPLILLVLHWLCLLLTAYLEKSIPPQSKKLTAMMFWIIPAISFLASAIMLVAAFGADLNVYAILPLILGAIFIFVGNYLPKTTRNVTMGIKIRWALCNDENWNATHRFGGKVFVIAGVLLLPTGLLPPAAFPFALIALLLATALLPLLYSYRFYKRQLAQGLATKEDYRAGNPMKSHKAVGIVSKIFIALIVIAVCVMMFTGTVETTLGESSLSVTATYWSGLTLPYAEIESVEYRESGVDGERVAGYGSARLLLGSFRSEELGNYTRYTYTGDLPCIILKTEQRTIVLGAENETAVKTLYEELLLKIAK